MLPDILTQEGYGGAPLKTVGKAGGFIGISLTLNSIYADYQQYNGVDFAVAAGSDVIPLAAGALGGSLITPLGPAGIASGSIAGGMAGDYIQYLIRKSYLTTKDSSNKNEVEKEKIENAK
ncbi:hypothetical protein [Megasphaera cerevisiae]|jgi:phage tail tape-measure protein|uniref:hypothetical protein n=1 Tax=Megasphaera cerevisiae TaxID=39029 RepID=UPI000942452F|nr:hypothetical protein [Megasphaera cerevisiae]OKY52990.1 hypothetical protein BSR42_09910 [Megasphaera cerevisiae]